MIRALGLIVLVLGALLASCGGGVARTPTTPSPDTRISTTPQPIGTATDTALAAGLLTTGDLGAGWSQVPTEGATIADSYYCGTKVASPPIAAFASFSNPAASRLMFEGVGKFDDEAAAAAFISAIRTAQQGCADEVSTDGVNGTHFKIDSFRVVTIGDEAVAEHDTTQFSGLPGGSGAYWFRIRAGRVVILIADVGVSETAPGLVDVPYAEAAGVAQKAHEKIAGVVAAGE